MPRATDVTPAAGGSVVGKAVATIGGVAAVVVLAYELLLGSAWVYGELEPAPAAWGGVAVGLGLGLIGPVSVLTTWLVDRRSSRPRLARIKRLEIVGLAVGIPTSLVLLVMIAVVSII